MHIRSFPEMMSLRTDSVIIRDTDISRLPNQEIRFLHYHSLCEAGLCRCGRGLWMVGDTVTMIQPGDVMIVPAGIKHYSRSVGGACCCEFIYFDEERVLDCCGAGSRVATRLPANIESVISCERQREFLRSMIEARDDVESALWYALFLKNLPDAASERAEPLCDNILAPAIHLIMTSYDEPLTADDLAEECRLCRSWFTKLFKKEYGMTPINFLNDFRAKTAAQLLRGDISVTEAAFMSGFGSPSDLYRHFRKKYGCSPSDFKMSQKNRGRKFR